MPRRQRFKPTRKNKPAVIEEDETIVPTPKPSTGSEQKPFDFEPPPADRGLQVHPDDGD
jgi:hypothetical protein